MALVAFLAVLLLLVDWWSWRVVRLPLEPFYFIRPFCISASLAALAGYLYVPLVHRVKIHQVLREEPSTHSPKRGAAMMGGLFFIPIGVLVAGTTTGFSSAEVLGSGAITFAFLVIGLLDDVLSFTKNRSYGLPRWVKLILQVKLFLEKVCSFHAVFS